MFRPAEHVGGARSVKGDFVQCAASNDIAGASTSSFDYDRASIESFRIPPTKADGNIVSEDDNSF